MFCAVLFAGSPSRFARQGSGHCSGELGPPANRVFKPPPETAAAKGRSMVLAVPLQDVEGSAPSVNHRKTRDRHLLASERLPSLLDLDFQEEAQRSTPG